MGVDRRTVMLAGAGAAALATPVRAQGAVGAVALATALRDLAGQAGELRWAPDHGRAGDGGGGLFWWDGAADGADDGGLVLRWRGGARGAWRRVGEPGVLDVRWFGAVGDGAADDTAALRAAFRAAGGARLQLPPGRTFRATGLLPMEPATRLAGGGSRLRFDVSGTTLCLQAHDECEIADIAVEVRGEQPDGGGSFQCPILIEAEEGRIGRRNVTVRNVTVSSNRPGGILIEIGGDSSNIVVENVYAPRTANPVTVVQAHWGVADDAAAALPNSVKHPHNIRIANVVADGWASGDARAVNISGAFAVTVENVTVYDGVARAVNVYAGDASNDFAREEYRDQIGHGITVRNCAFGGVRAFALHVNGQPNGIPTCTTVLPMPAVFEGISARGPRGQRAGIGARFQHCAGVVLRQARFTDLGFGVVVERNVTRLTVDHVTVQNVGQQAFTNLRGGAEASDDLRIQRAHFAGGGADRRGPGAGALVYSASGSLAIVDSTLGDAAGETATAAIHADAGAVRVRGVRLAGFAADPYRGPVQQETTP